MIVDKGSESFNSDLGVFWNKEQIYFSGAEMLSSEHFVGQDLQRQDAESQ